LFTLPYSPRLNPVEYAFRSIKATYRGNCPPENHDEFDYAALLAHVLFSQTTFVSCFEKVFKTVRAAKSSCGQNFSGYEDIKPLLT
jgi:hypothetical protein